MKKLDFTIGRGINAVIAIMAITLVAFGLVVANGFGTLEDSVLDEVARLVEDGQRDKVMVATQNMANALGAAIADIEDPDEQEAEARRLVENVIYEKDGSGYFFVYKETRVVALPTKPELVGEDLGDRLDVNGVQFITRMWELSQEGGGFWSTTFTNLVAIWQPR